MKFVLMTGATGGVGSALVEGCLSQSDHVTGLYRSNVDGAQELRRRHELKSGQLELLQVDLADEEATRQMAARLAGAHPWDAFVHLCAPPLEMTPFAKQNPRHFNDAWRSMVQAGVLLTQAILPGMRKRGGGHIVYCLSAVTLGRAPKGMAAYTVAKYGLLGLARSVASECDGTGVSVNAVSPGPMDTPLLRNLPEIAKSGLCAAAPEHGFLDPAVVAGTILRILDTPPTRFFDVNLPILSSKVPPPGI